ncbi:MAG: Ser-Thr-rich GPI-anchored membrane family protein [Candidatus Cloacimonadaceae bacterium]|nr:Ser-Thr-rich GPI-anchored membrane family protein [Candidatus Cloacimonadaceae bacterium]
MKKLLIFAALLLAVALMTAQNSPLTVLSPNGGESWTHGNTYQITWSQQNLAGPAMIHLVGSNPASNMILIASGIPIDSGNFTWTIPPNIPVSNDYRVRVSIASNTGTMIFDLSDAPFAITANTNPPPYITVLSPNGGEIWQSGETHAINWEYFDLEGEVKISLVQSANTPEIVIAPEVPIQTGNFMWTIPANIPPGTNYRVHIVWLSMMTVYFGDVSDAPFSIINDDPPPPPPPTGITVLSPNGGETWMAGTMHPITWSAPGITSMMQIILLGANNPNGGEIIIAQAVPNSGIFHWMIPATFPVGENYLVRVRALANIPIFDDSDAFFSIFANIPPPPPPQPLVILSPNGGETWTKGETYPITWSFGNLAGNVMLQLISGNNTAPDITIAHSIPVQMGLFPWTIPAAIPAGDHYLIRVSLIASTGVMIHDISDGFFSIQEGTNPPPQPIVVLSPNGGEVWETGTPQVITWVSAMLAGNVEIALMRGNNTVAPFYVIAPSVPNMNAFTWIVPPHIPAGQDYKVRVRQLSATGAFDLSDGFFSINTNTPPPPPPQNITILSPNGGETWNKGETYPITWQMDDMNGNVAIILVRVQNNHRRRFVIAHNAPNTGSFAWTIPNFIPDGNNYRIVVRLRDNPASFDVSDAPFAIVDNPIAVTVSPNPVREGTKISFELTESTPTRISIYNIKGQLVRTLIDSANLSGNQNIYWDGKDNGGRAVQAGIYFLRVTAGDRISHKRLILTK